jgi:hypothetical protein
MTDTTIYRCGWCGTPVEADGSLLAAWKRVMWPYEDEYLAAHPAARVEHVNGFCCPYGDGTYYREECPDAE